MWKCSFYVIVRDEDTTDTRQDYRKTYDSFQVSIMSEFKKSLKDVQSSLDAHTYRQYCPKYEIWAFGPWVKSIEQGSQKSLEKMFLLSRKEAKGWHMSRHQVMWQKWRHVVIRQKQTLFSSSWMSLLRIYVEDLIVNRNATSMSYPDVFDLTFCFSDLLLLSFIRGFQIRNCPSTIFFEGQLTNSHKNRKVSG